MERLPHRFKSGTWNSQLSFIAGKMVQDALPADTLKKKTTRKHNTSIGARHKMQQLRQKETTMNGRSSTSCTFRQQVCVCVCECKIWCRHAQACISGE